MIGQRTQADEALRDFAFSPQARQLGPETRYLMGVALARRASAPRPSRPRSSRPAHA
jgi:hypothetical protein